MNRKQFDKEPRRPVTKDEFLEALESILLAPRGDTRSENREPTKEELERRYRLDRRKGE